MSQNLPTKLLKLKTLAEVPRAEFCDAPKIENPEDQSSRMSFLKKLRKGQQEPAKPAQVRKPLVKKTFNAAVWIRFQNAPSQPISLWLTYRDERDEFAVMVDEARLSAGTATMLSGCVTIEARGRIEYLRACCGGAREGERFTVEELYVQREAEIAVSSSSSSARSA